MFYIFLNAVLEILARFDILGLNRFALVLFNWIFLSPKVSGVPLGLNQRPGKMHSRDGCLKLPVSP
jgi:hypothetical protein